MFFSLSRNELQTRGKVSRTLELVVICRALLLTGVRFKQVEFEDNIRALDSVTVLRALPLPLEKVFD